MKTTEGNRIGKLISRMTVNDYKAASDFEEEPEEPREAMDELVKVGGPVVKRLLELLRNSSKFSCSYALELWA